MIQNDIYVTFINRKNKLEELETFYSISSLEHFEGKVLITTPVVETGINFRDEVGNIMIEANYYEQFMQMIGRRRVKEGEVVNLYISQRSERYFRMLLEDIERILAQYQKFRCYGKKNVLELLNSNKLDYSLVKKFTYIKEDELCINELSIEELLYRKNVLKERIKMVRNDETSFIKEQLEWVNMKDFFSTQNMIRENIRESVITCFKEAVLQCYLSKKIMSKEEEIKWLSGFISIVKEIDKKYIVKNIFSDKSFNKLCEDISFPYYIVSSNKNQARKTYYWIEEIGPKDLENQNIEEENDRVD